MRVCEGHESVASGTTNDARNVETYKGKDMCSLYLGGTANEMPTGLFREILPLISPRRNAKRRHTVHGCTKATVLIFPSVSWNGWNGVHTSDFVTQTPTPHIRVRVGWVFRKYGTNTTDAKRYVYYFKILGPLAKKHN